jgi:nicotinate-nucleotide adenylyltransferase
MATRPEPGAPLAPNPSAFHRATRIGLIGGTFDPIHYGHLVAAEEARAVLGLERVLFAPAGEPPHKRGRHVTPVEHRVQMVRLAIASNPHFELSTVDVLRTGPSYSVDTLRILKDELGPEADVWFIIGLDSLVDILSWREPARLVELARIVAVTRPGYATFDVHKLEPSIPKASERIRIVPIPEMNISSSALRERVLAGMPIKYQLPEEVEAYIYANGLYSPQNHEAGGLSQVE